MLSATSINQRANSQRRIRATGPERLTAALEAVEERSDGHEGGAQDDSHRGLGIAARRGREGRHEQLPGDQDARPRPQPTPLAYA
jgi:hypothetical protein